MRHNFVRNDGSKSLGELDEPVLSDAVLHRSIVLPVDVRSVQVVR